MSISKRTLIKTLLLALPAAGLVSLAGCGDKKPVAEKALTVVKVGVNGDFNAQWDTVAELVAPQGIKIELVKFSDYATPNRALNDGDIDLNSFQHKAYLRNDIKQNGYKIVPIADTVIAPIRLFNNKAKISKVSDIKDGDLIGVPSDLTNLGRALRLLEAAGLIEVDPSKGLVANKSDITKYNVKIVLKEAESGLLKNLLPDLTAAAINGGNAFIAQLDPYKDSIFSESIDPKKNPYIKDLVNVIVAREKDKDNPNYQKIVKAFQSPEVVKTLYTAYQGAYVPVWPGAKELFDKLAAEDAKKAAAK